MTIYDQDTDPSTPESRHASAGSTTDPGIGPPSKGGKAMGVIVPPSTPRAAAPASAPTGRKKDSVELLLDGIAGPRPDRPKTTPQTAGQASAAYHAKHAVMAAKTSPDEEPKVVVELPTTAPPEPPPTVRIDPAARERARAEVETYVSGAKFLPRVVVAVLAGLVVVAGIFAVVEAMTKRPAPPVESAAPALGPPAPPAEPAAVAPFAAGPSSAAGLPSAAASAAMPAPEAPVEAPASAAAVEAPASAATVESIEPVAPPPRARRFARPAGGTHTKPGGSGGTPAHPADLGEFKTSF
jgi:hypothetical protein